VRETGTTLDRSLLARLKNGEAAALGEVYERYADDVYRMALRTTASSADAYDVTHDVFLGLPEAVGRYDPDRPFGTWLRGVTVRTALLKMRTVRRRREASAAPLRHIGARSDVHAVIDRLALERALDRLPPDLRIVFVLREVEGMSYVDIAEMLGVTENVAGVRLHRARRRLQDLLGGDR